MHRELALVRLCLQVLVVADVVHAILGDHTQVHVGAGAQVVVDARTDRLRHQLLCLLHVHVVLQHQQHTPHTRDVAMQAGNGQNLKQ